MAWWIGVSTDETLALLSANRRRPSLANVLQQATSETHNSSSGLDVFLVKVQAQKVEFDVTHALRNIAEAASLGPAEAPDQDLAALRAERDAAAEALVVARHEIAQQSWKINYLRAMATPSKQTVAVPQSMPGGQQSATEARPTQAAQTLERRMA